MKIPEIFSHKKSLYVIIAFGILLLASLNFWGWYFMGALQDDIILQLKKQLKHITTTTAKVINGDDLENLLPGAETSPPALFYQQMLWEVKRSAELENVLILSVDGRLLVDYRINFRIGDSLRVPLNRQLLDTTLSGKSPEPELIKFGNQYFLTAYAPIYNSLGDVSALLFIESPAQFFSALTSLRRGLFYFGLGGLGVILLFSGIIILATRQIFSVERQLNEKERMAQLGQMAAMVAHEIRNPLSIIKGSAEVLQKKYASQNDELLKFIPEEIERLNRLVNDFLQFAHRKSLKRERFDPNEVIENCLKRFRDDRIHLKLDGNCRELETDRDALTQILLNLVENARQACKEEGEIVVSTGRGSHKSAAFILKVADNGEGMDEETKKMMFDPFYTTRAKGSGLGMAITRQLVRLMGGGIGVQSQLNRGTEITITLPQKLPR